MKKICFIAQFPPPIHGLAKAVDTLYNSSLAGEFDFSKIDITNNKKFSTSLFKIFISRADLFYFTISQTKGGNIRDLMILKLLYMKKKKCLIHLHGGFYRHLVDEELPFWQKKANYTMISKVDGAIVLGPSLNYIFQGMISDNKIFTVPNCVDDEYLMSNEDFQMKIECISERKIKHILYLSNFISTKGYRKVLEMARLESERQGPSRFHFDFAGVFFDKAEKDFFDSYIITNKLEEYVTYHGVVKGDKKRSLLKLCDVFVLLSTYPNEGQPISILEAMGNGMIIITTNHAGIPDEVTDGVNGIVVDKNNIDTKRIYSRLLEFDQYEKVEKSNRSIVMEKFNQENYIDGMHRCFLSVLGMN